MINQSCIAHLTKLKQSQGLRFGDSEYRYQDYLRHTKEKKIGYVDLEVIDKINSLLKKMPVRPAEDMALVTPNSDDYVHLW